MIEVWAPRAERVRLHRPGHDDVELTRRPSRRDGLVHGGGRRRSRATATSTASCSTTRDAVRPDPRSRRQPRGRARGSVVDSTPPRSRGPTQRWTGPPARRRGDLRAAHRHVHPRGHARRRDRPARPPRRARRRLRRAAAGQRVQRQPGTGATTACSGTPCTRATAGPTAYQRFVDACHGAGLGVIQDVVYNHLGPSGNYLPEFGPYLRDGAAQHVGRRASTSTSREVRRLHRRQRAACGCATTTSTACGSTPCTRCTRRRRRGTSCRSSPRRRRAERARRATAVARGDSPRATCARCRGCIGALPARRDSRSTPTCCCARRAGTARTRAGSSRPTRGGCRRRPG